MMTFDTQVLRSVFRKTSPLLFTVAAFLLLSLIPVIPHQAYATDQECRDTGIAGFEAICMNFLDANGQVKPDAQYLKCADTVKCDPDDPADPDEKTTKRCCIVPQDGTYGGHCMMPDLTREKIGVGGVGGNQFANWGPSNCNTDPEAQSPSGFKVFVVPPKEIRKNNVRTFQEQSLKEWYYSFPHTDLLLSKVPEIGQSEADLPIWEETIQVSRYNVFMTESKFGTTWYYQVAPDLTRRYFVGGTVLGNPYYINGYGVIDNLANPLFPKDPRESSGGDPISRLPCHLLNAIKKPVYTFVHGLTGYFLESENMPDISLLCSKGTPQFTDPSLIGFDQNGKITGLNESNCYCVDANSGPSVAAVLLCTRYIGGLNDVYAPWRLLIPVPPNGGSGSRFFGLLYGGTSHTNTIEEFYNGVRTDIRDFFNSDTEVKQWITNILTTQYLKQDNIFMSRFFPKEHNLNDPDPIISNPDKFNAFKSNLYVRQYISCLSCARWGGFPTAIGCLPMDRVDRFLAEGVLGIGITIGGAISVLCIIFGAIQFQLSEGESAKVQKAQKLITQCIIGLLIIIFSLFLLRFVGVDLLRIYGLG